MITVVGSLNMDLFIETARLPFPGETVAGSNFRRAPGGKGANQAVAVARLNHTCAIIGAVGRDAFGDELVSNLEAEGIETTRVKRCDNTPSGIAMIVVDAKGQNQIVVSAGANATLTTAEVERHADLLQRSRAVIVQLETSLSVAETALRLARKTGVLTVLNPAPALAGAEQLLSHCDWVIPNESEAASLSEVAIDSPDFAAKAAEVLRARHRCQNVAITLGARGAWLDTASFIGTIPGVPVEAVDTVGAGDAFIGAFVMRLVEGARPFDAAGFACAVAALAVTRRGAQASMPDRSEVDLFLSQRSPPVRVEPIR